jgi:type II secretory pathway pseudopilin PulG
MSVIRPSIDKRKKERGFGLVEVMLAFGVSVIIITALVSLATFVLKSATTSSRMMQGTRLVNREIETIRAVRDLYKTDENLSWIDFYNAVNSLSTPCRAISGTSVCPANSCHVELDNESMGYILPNSEDFDDISVCFGSRIVESSPGVTDPSKIDIIAIATWTIGEQQKYVHNYTRLADWTD